MSILGLTNQKDYAFGPWTFSTFPRAFNFELISEKRQINIEISFISFRELFVARRHLIIFSQYQVEEIQSSAVQVNARSNSL